MRGVAEKSLVLSCALLLSGCQIGYVVRQGMGQWSVLWRSRPVEEALADPGLPSKQKARILYIEEVASFGEKDLGLARNGNYTTFLDTQGEPISYSLFASSRTQLAPLVWSFPLIGQISYLGFFDLEDARKAQRSLEEAGYDTHVGTVSAYSTLGWFRDPILSSMLEEDEVELARLILHEMTHGTIYRPGESAFNESLASFVGDRGAELFLQRRYGIECSQLVDLRERFRKEEAFDLWLDGFEKKLQALYASDLSEPEKLSQREEVFAAAKVELRAVSESFPERPFRGLLQAPFNNAIVLALRTYRSEPELFERAYRQCGSSLRRLLRVVAGIPDRADAIQALRRKTQS